MLSYHRLIAFNFITSSQKIFVNILFSVGLIKMHLCMKDARLQATDGSVLDCTLPSAG